MEIVRNTKENLESLGTATRELREELISQAGSSEYIMNCSFTDYGGSILDKAYYEVYRQTGEMLSELTRYRGANAYLRLSSEDKDSIEGYWALTDSVEEMLGTQEYEAVLEFIEDNKDDLPDIDSSIIEDYIRDGGHYTTQGIDIDFDKMVKELKE